MSGNQQLLRGPQGNDLEGGGPGEPPKGGPRRMNVAFFAAAVCVVVGSLVGFICTLFTLQWVDALEFLYLTLAGVLLALLDTPFLPSLMIFHQSRTWIGRYVHILMRVTGKGMVLIFLGSTLWAGMMVNVKGTFFTVLSVIFGLVIVIVGLISLIIGMMKSWNLEKVRTAYAQPLPGEGIDRAFDMNARLNPSVGLFKQEWEGIARKAGQKPPEADITLIFNAISTNPDRKTVSKEDLMDWASGGKGFLPKVFL